MGTRCDFYLGRGLQAKYLGSVGHDAFADEMAVVFADITTEEQFTERLKEVFSQYGEIAAHHGWPWPWPSSVLTDTVVAFDEGRAWLRVKRDGESRWAPASNLDDVSDMRCEFANMLEQEQSTAGGRLRIALRRAGILAQSPEQALGAILTNGAYLLSRLSLHLFEQDGKLYCLQPHRTVESLLGLSAALQEAGQELDEMVAEHGLGPDDIGALALWLRDSAEAFDCASEDVHITPTTPVQFGQALPESVYGQLESKVLPLGRFDNAVQLKQGLSLLERYLPHAPFAFVRAYSLELHGRGIIEVRKSELEAWETAPKDELGGKNFFELAATKEGRMAMLRYAVEQLEDEET